MMVFLKDGPGEDAKDLDPVSEDCLEEWREETPLLIDL